MKEIFFSNISNFKDLFNVAQWNKILKIFSKDNRLIDVLYYFPKKYIQYTEISELSENLIRMDVTIQLKIIEHKKQIFSRKYKSPYKIMCLTQGQTPVIIMFFQTLKNYIVKFERNKIVKIRGKLGFYKNDFVITHPSLIYIGDNFLKIDNKEEQLIPRYKTMASVKNADIKGIMSIFINLIKSFSPEEFFQNIKEAHNPKNNQTLEEAINYFVFQEFVANIYAMKNAKNELTGRNCIIHDNLKQIVMNNFVFSLTNDQQKALSEIEKDQCSKEKMIRLLQGDVGSGKTIVAILAACNAVQNNLSALILAPTTILANQYLNLLNKLFFGSNVVIELLTSHAGQKKRKEIISRFKHNEINILVGTHSLFNPDLINNNIGMIIIDEQHKFGVQQRLSLIEKSKEADILMMSATPIPRTLAMSIYGNLNISIIFEKPAFQKEIITRMMSMEKYDEIIANLKKQLDEGKRCYWVCPLIDSEDEEEGSIFKRFENVKSSISPEYISILHGKMKEDEKNMTIRKFQTGESKLLISTTVVEVGVNVPEATIMIIENAEKFGLSQIHQLRGRVGRGDEQSYCILLHNNGNDLERLKILRENSNGFEIAKHDMKMRGFGNILGTMQSGDMSYKIANLQRDHDILNEALEFVEQHMRNKTEENTEFIKTALKIYFPYEWEKYKNV